MAFRLSTGARNELVGTSGKNFYQLFNNGVLDIFTGAQPTHADYAETGTKLARISSTSGTTAEDGCKFGTSSNGVMPIGTPTWQGRVIAAGVAGWFRYYGSGGTSGSSNTEIRFDGSIGISGADLNLSHTNLALDSIVEILTANVTQPEE